MYKYHIVLFASALRQAQGILHSSHFASDEEWRRGDSNPKLADTEPLQLDNNSATELNRQPSNGISAEQHNTLPIQNNNNSEHQIGANMVHQNLPSDLAEVVAVWPELAEHIKAAIKAWVKTQERGAGE